MRRDLPTPTRWRGSSRTRRCRSRRASGVVLVDEAGLLGTQDMLQLFDTAAKIEARVVLVGDRKQHRSVSAGEPLKLLEEKAGLPVAEVTEIMRQTGDYRKAAMALSEGRMEDGILPNSTGSAGSRKCRTRSATSAGRRVPGGGGEKNRNGENKSALVVSPTHAEAARITGAIRSKLHEEGRLSREHTMATWVPTHLTDAEKADAANYEPGDMLQFHQHAPGHKNGSRLVVGEGSTVAGAACRSFRGLPAGPAKAGGRRPHPRHRQRQDEGRQASSSTTGRCLRSRASPGRAI